MRECDGFDVFLDAGGNVALVAPGVQGLQVGRDGEEEIVDLGQAGVIFFRDRCGERSGEGADAGTWVLGGLSLRWWGVEEGDRREGYRCSEKILRKHKQSPLLLILLS